MAAKYIGPVKKSSGSTVTTPPPTGPVMVVTTISRNTMKQANPCQAENSGAGGGGGIAGGGCNYSGSLGMLMAFVGWNGGVLIGDKLVTFNGGENSFGPGMAFDIPTGLWSQCTPATTCTLQIDYVHDPTFDGVWGVFADGIPPPGHTYDCLEGMPPEWGGGPLGSLVVPQRDVIYGVGSTSMSMRCDLATKTWYRAAPTRIQTSVLNTGGGNSWVRDANNRRFLGIAGATSQTANNQIATLTFPDNSGAGVQGHGPQFASTLVPHYPVQRQAPAQHKVLIAGAGADWNLLLQVYDSDTLAAIRTVTWTGDSIYNSAGLGLAYVPDTNEFWAMPTASPTYNGTNPNPEYSKPVVELFRITPPSDWFGGTWRVVRVPITGAIGYTPNGMWKRLDYHPPSKSLIWASNYDGPVYSLKVA